MGLGAPGRGAANEMDIAEIEVTRCGEFFIVSFVVRKKRSDPAKTEVTLHDILRSVDS